jgi:hypothetical protein
MTPIIGREDNQALCRWGEGTTIRILLRRCPRCGGRMEQIVHARSGDVIVTRCRGVCR